MGVDGKHRREPCRSGSTHPQYARELQRTVSISISAYDLSRLEAKAASQGIDTQNLIEGILRDAAA